MQRDEINVGKREQKIQRIIDFSAARQRLETFKCGALQNLC